MQSIPTSPPNKRQGGYTIVELSIALTVIAILIIAGLAGVNSLLVSSKANSQIEDSGRAMAKLQAILTSTAVSGLTTASGIGMGLFPSSRVANNIVSTVMGGGNEFVKSNSGTALTSSANGIDLAVNTGAVYTLTNIPKAVCTDIAASLASISKAAYIYAGTAPTESNAGDNTNLTTANNIKVPGGTVQGATMGSKCNSADVLHMSFILPP